MTRRSTFTDQSVTYGAIGATLDDDLLRYPPAGYRPAADAVRLGSGRDRFDRAAEELMTWKLQENAGLRVEDVELATGVQYSGVRFGPDGAPLPDQPSDHEPRVDADGRPWVAAGVTATLRGAGQFRGVETPVLVVYIVDEPSRVGFAYGTTAVGPESGEESFVLEHRDDDTVWLSIRSIMATRGGLHAVTAPSVRRRRRELTRAELRALHPVGGA